MPAWIHDRAEHVLAKNPSMNKSTAFAIATQQSHKMGKSPKGYGTKAGKRTARAKFDKPRKEYVRGANPGKLESPKMTSGKEKQGMGIGQGAWKQQAGFTPTGMKTPTQRLKKSMNVGKFNPDKGLKPLSMKVGSVDFAAFTDEVGKLGEVNQMRLNPKPHVKAVDPTPPNKLFKIKQGFATSQYSGSQGGGRPRYHSMIPPWRQPQLKTAGPPPPKEKSAAIGLTPASRLSQTQKVGAPKASAPPGPSIAQVSKPIGFGKPKPGAIKSFG